MHRKPLPGSGPKKPFMLFFSACFLLSESARSHYLISRLLRTFWCPRRAFPPPSRFQDDKCCNAARAFFTMRVNAPLPLRKLALGRRFLRLRKVRTCMDFDSGRIFNEKNAFPRSLSPFSMPNPLLQVEKETESRFLD